VTEKNAALKDERALLTVGGMSEFWYIQMFHAMFDEENITLKGFPGLQGSGAMFFVDNSMGISSKSPHKDVAWDMIKIFLSEEYQSVKNDNLFYFPSREDCFEEMLRECSKKKSKYNSYLGMEMSNNEDRIIVTALSIEDAERIRQMVYDTKMVYHKSYLYDMVIEEASSYFSGNKRIDDVYEIIKDRIDLYYKEGK
jgi:ABC-type glycerol-3-phosphate transport system substrate-binding protein